MTVISSVVKSLFAALAAACLVFGFASPAMAKTYPPTGPNDPSYAPLENTSKSVCLQKNVNQEQHYFYSFEPQCATNAHDPGGASGMSVDKAWSTYTTGDPHVVMAYVEAGINWHQDQAKDLVNKVWLNVQELPLPQDAARTTHATYDLNGDGTVNVQDYAGDARCNDKNANGYLDPEDLIVCFSNGVDSDSNGFIDDISGWDFYDHQNDPATYDATYGHSDNQMRQAGAEGNNGIDGVGMCPACMILPIKAGAEALDRTDDLAQAWLYADHMGAKVVVSVTADLGYSSYMRQTVNKLWRDGVVMAESSNDFDSLDHQGGMFWPHVLPGNGLVSNTQGYDTVPSTLTNEGINLATKTFSERADETSWGTHAMFSASNDGGSTSESTPTVAGTLGLILSWGGQAGLPGGPLTGPEAIQVTRATVDDITGNPNPPTGWVGAPGWDLQYGYGRPNVYRAMTAIKAGDIPPTGWLNGPDWYSLYDPTKTKNVTITGHVAAPRSSSYHWQLEYGLGPQPTTWNTINRGNGTKPFDGSLGTLDLSKIPSSFWNAPFTMSKTKTLETNEQYDVTLRVRVFDASNRMGEERRAIAVHHDAGLLPNFPKKVGADAASQPALADLQGRGHLAAVFGDADGAVHAIDGVTGNELPGWPVHTAPTKPELNYSGIDPGHEPILSPVTVGDLHDDGTVDVVVTSTTGRTYVWNAQGVLQTGWPKTSNTGVTKPPIPRPALNFTRLATQGATASPVLVALESAKKELDVVQAGWDGYVHAWRPDGTIVPGWPVRVDSAGLKPPPGYSVINDQKIDVTPSVAYLEGATMPDIVVQSQYSFTLGGGIQPLGIGHVFAFRADGTPVPHWPISVPGLIVYNGSAQEFITEGTTAPIAADVDGDGKEEVAVSPGIFSASELYDGTGHLRATYGPVPNPFTQILQGDFSLEDMLHGNLPADAPVTFTTSGAFGHIGVTPTLSYAQAGSGGASVATSLLLNGSGEAIKNYERGYDAVTALPLPGFPQQMQGLDFLGSPVIADVDGSGRNAVIDGADSSALMAWNNTGLVAGWPKFQTGWTVFSPSVGDLRSDGHNDVVATTREGYLLAWGTPGKSTNNQEWWSYHHDERRTGRYGVDTRPPGTLRNMNWSPGQLTATFTAPGDDWYAGMVTSYIVKFGSGAARYVPPTGPAGTVQKLAVPPGTQTVTVQAVDEEGNFGPKVSLGATATPKAAVAGGSSTFTTSGLGGALPVGGVALLAGALLFRRRR